MTLWRNNTGAMVDARGQLVRYGQAGSADLLGLISPAGQFLALEVKRPGGRQTDLQRAWQAMVERHGGIYLVVCSVEQAVAELNRRGALCSR